MGDFNDFKLLTAVRVTFEKGLRDQELDYLVGKQVGKQNMERQ